MAGFSYSSEKLVKMQDYVANFSDDRDLVFVVYAEYNTAFVL